MPELEAKIKKAIQNKDQEALDRVIEEILYERDRLKYIDLLNELLLVPFHYQHQYIARAMQDLKTASSVPFIKKVLESKFEGIPYNGSDSRSMATWFSWALYSIGTKEAIEVIKDQANSEDTGIREEMRYRLAKLNFVEN